MRVVLTDLSVTGRRTSSPVSMRLAAYSLAPKPRRKLTLGLVQENWSDQSDHSCVTLTHPTAQKIGHSTHA